MKIKTLHKRDQTIYRKESTDPRRRMSIGVIMFWIIFITILIFLARGIYNSYSFAKGFGYVEAESVLVQSLITARIQDIECEVLDNVEKGKSLVRLDPTTIQGEILNKEFEFEIRKINYENQLAASQINLQKSQINQQKSIIDINNNVKLLLQKLYSARQDVQRLQGDYDKYKQLVNSNVSTRSELDKIQEKIHEARQRETLITVEYQLENQKSKIYKSNIENATDYVAELPQPPQINYWQTMLKETVLYAPLAGQVAEIYKKPGEVIKIGESAMKIYDMNIKYIRAQFYAKDCDLVKKDVNVDIEFKNGLSTTGIIRKIFISATPLREEFQKNYEKPAYYVVADIEVKQEVISPYFINTEAMVYIHRNDTFSLESFKSLFTHPTNPPPEKPEV